MTQRRTDLRALLEAHQPADEREHGFRDEMLRLVDHPQDPFSRQRYDPGHFTASAFVLSPDRRALLLVHHVKLGRWLQPGGHVEPDDTCIAAAARREVREETGIDALEQPGSGMFDLDVHVIPARAGEPAHRHYDVRLLFVSGSAACRPGEGVRGARWVPLEQVASIESDDSVMRAVAKLNVSG